LIGIWCWLIGQHNRPGFSNRIRATKVAASAALGFLELPEWLQGSKTPFKRFKANIF
jgi:hypothetical protein